MIEGEDDDTNAVMNTNRQLAYIPAISASQSFWYKKHWIRVSRTTKEGGYYGRREDVLEIWYVPFHKHSCRARISFRKNQHNGP